MSSRPAARAATWSYLPRQVALALWLWTPGVALAGDLEFAIHGFYIIDFLVFVGILVYVGRKPIAAALDSRYKTVVAEIEEAKALRMAAQASYDEYRARIEHLDSELTAALQEVRVGTRTEVQRILQDARESAERISAEESARLSQEGKRLRAELAEAAATTALRLAEAELKQAINADVQRSLVERTLLDLETGAGSLTGATTSDRAGTHAPLAKG